MMNGQNDSLHLENLAETDAIDAGHLMAPRQGDLCPVCGKGRLDYNGLLELECPACGYRNTGGAIGT